MKAVIFDLNGTVLNDEDEYAAAFREVLRKLGKKVDKKFPHTRGIGVNENWPLLLAKYKIKTRKTPEELAGMTQDAYLKKINRVNVKNGLRKLVSELKNCSIVTALATSNSWLIVESVFDELGIESLFDVVTTCEEVSFNKPSPEIFLVTAEKLATDPEDCLVFEDSQSGIEAAQAAGMKVVGIYHDEKHKKTLKDANMLIKSFDEVRIDKLLSLYTNNDKQ